MTLQHLLQTAADRHASDLHLQDGMPPILRIDGNLVAEQGDALTADDIEALLVGMMTEDERPHLKALDHQTSLDVDGVGRVRLSLFRENRRLCASLRLIPSRVPDLDRIGLPPGARRLCDLSRGLVLVTGPTGSGKTTTIMSMLDHINTTRAARILSIGDPVECVLKPARSMIIVREVGVDTSTFASALRYAMRQDPDIIHVGEMRDLETVMLCITAAEMGHMVMTTMHCQNTSDAILRLISVFPQEQRAQVREQLAQTIAGVVAQRIMPRCDRQGRAAAYEVLIGTPRMQQMIRRGATDYTAALEEGADEGMQSLDQSLARLVSAGTVDLDTAGTHATSPERLRTLIHKQ